MAAAIFGVTVTSVGSPTEKRLVVIDGIGSDLGESRQIHRR